MAVLIVIACLLVASWGLFVSVVLPGSYRTGGGTFGVGLALTAFLLGIRHGFDADHIAAIDNTTRKLLESGRDGSTVGLWFALGHSTVVLFAVGLLAGGVSALAGQVGDDNSPLRALASLWGPSVSSVFLLVIGGVNLVALISMIRLARRREAVPAPPGGPVVRLLGSLTRRLDRPWKMVVVGLLFGLGLDTASTVALLLIAGGAGIIMPWYAAMVLPLLFTPGMVSCDGINSLLMTRLYRWSIDRPDRRLRYNATLISLSVAVAFIVSGVGISGVLLDIGITWPPVVAAADIDLGDFGFIIAGMLAIAWITSWFASRAAVPTNPAE